MKVVDEENSNKPFGGKFVVLRGDFRKILFVVRKGSRYDIVKEEIDFSQLWKDCKFFKLLENMRLTSHESVESVVDIKEFVDWILKIGDGNMNLNEMVEGIIEIPQHLLIEHNDSRLLNLAEFVYPRFLHNMSNANFFHDGAILCPTTKCVDQVNEFIICLMPREEVTYLSSNIPFQ